MMYDLLYAVQISPSLSHSLNISFCHWLSLSLLCTCSLRLVWLFNCSTFFDLHKNEIKYMYEYMCVCGGGGGVFVCVSWLTTSKFEQCTSCQTICNMICNYANESTDLKCIKVRHKASHILHAGGKFPAACHMQLIANHFACMFNSHPKKGTRQSARGRRLPVTLT